MSAVAKRKPYPAYKDSGVEWLGQLPAYWEMKRLKHVSRLSAIYGANEPAGNYADEGVRFLRTTDINDDGTLNPNNAVFLERDRVRDYLLEEGDLLLSRSGTLGRSFVYKKDLHGDCAFAGYLVCFRLKDQLIPSMAFYFTKSRPFFDWLSTSAIESTIGNINGQKYANISLPVPPLPEQRAIAAFLDRETAKIDAMVAKKERLIELLQEKRDALITQAVTKGLDPTVPMKDSGVEWPSEYPKHWEALQIRRKITLQRGVDITKDEQNEGTVPVVSSGGVSSYHDQPLAYGPGVVVGRKGTAGAVYYIEQDFWPHDTTLWVREFRGNVPRYVFYKLSSMELSSFDTGSANPTLNRNLIHPVVVTWPPVDEQFGITAFLDKETAKLDDLIAKVREGIEKLKEYRTALISTAVTGKIDVRNAA